MMSIDAIKIRRNNYEKESTFYRIQTLVLLNIDSNYLNVTTITPIPLKRHLNFNKTPARQLIHVTLKSTAQQNKNLNFNILRIQVLITHI